ncbi:MAG: DUF4007 family protein [Fimbriimonadaceae bacterium]
MTLRTMDPNRLSFGGHETFPFRLGWIRKGVSAASKDPYVFAAPDAVVRLGVGKNMVRSIRTWCLATQMLAEAAPSGASRLKPLVMTPTAKAVFGEEGDPFLEDPGTLWLLHWLLVTNPDKLSLWRIAFMDSKENEFTKPELVDLALAHAARSGQRTEAGSVSRDVFVRTYTAARSGSSEEDFSCPLVELGLISAGGHDRFAFVVGNKRTLPDRVFGFALAQFLESFGTADCSLSDATYLPGSPGQAFRLEEDSVVAHLRELESLDPETWLVDVDGPIRRVGLRKPVDPIALLAEHYREVSI